MARLICDDWRGIPPQLLAPLYASEVERWSAVLDWDTASNWEHVERGREIGTALGFVVRNETGTIVGWTYYTVHEATVQVGGFVASSDQAASLMLDAILSDDALESARQVTFFAFSDLPGLTPALRQRGLNVDRYWYLSRDARPAAAPAIRDVRKWRPENAVATAALLGRAYAAKDDSRPFAPQGTPEEWTDYVAQLTTGTGCGVLLPDACLCVPSGPNELAAVVLVTRISDGSAHVAQLAVDPQAQGRHLGSGLLELACNAVSLTGARRVTLLVGGRNSRARSMYESAHFEPMASFVSGGTARPRRPVSAPVGHQVMARR